MSKLFGIVLTVLLHFSLFVLSISIPADELYLESLFKTLRIRENKFRNSSFLTFESFDVLKEAHDLFKNASSLQPSDLHFRRANMFASFLLEHVQPRAAPPPPPPMPPPSNSSAFNSSSNNLTPKIRKLTGSGFWVEVSSSGVHASVDTPLPTAQFPATTISASHNASESSQISNQLTDEGKQSVSVVHQTSSSEIKSESPSSNPSSSSSSSSSSLSSSSSFSTVTVPQTSHFSSFDPNAYLARLFPIVINPAEADRVHARAQRAVADGGDGHGQGQDQDQGQGQGRSAERAVELFEEAVRLDPQRAKHWCHLGMALIQVDRFAAAKLVLNRALLLDPQFSQASLEMSRLRNFAPELFRQPQDMHASSFVSSASSSPISSSSVPPSSPEKASNTVQSVHDSSASPQSSSSPPSPPSGSPFSAPSPTSFSRPNRHSDNNYIRENIREARAECQQHQTEQITHLAPLLPKFTQLGFDKRVVPAALFWELQSFYAANKHNAVDEGILLSNCLLNTPEVRTSAVWIDLQLAQSLDTMLRPILNEWSNEPFLELTAIYGARVYHRGSILAPHIDRIRTHVISVVINVEQEAMDQPWPFFITDHDGVAHNLTLAPGEMILYESASCPHGRPTPLQGKRFVNIFMHYRPPDWEERALTGRVQELLRLSQDEE